MCASFNIDYYLRMEGMLHFDVGVFKAMVNEPKLMLV